MRNRPRVPNGTVLAMVPILFFSSLLGAQTAHQDLARAVWVRPMAAPVPAAFAGTAPSPPATVSADAPVLRWYHGLAFLGVVAALSPLDEAVRDEVQDRRTSGRDDFSKVIRHVGQPEVYATVALGTVAVGLVSGNSKITRAGGRISAGLALGGLVAGGLKLAVGRRRPFRGEEQYTFHPFTKTDSWPSGHTMTAFALATGVSDEVHSTPVTVLMYTLATGVAWSRMNDNKHWLTDVVGGAAIGITSSKIMSGHWRVFGLSAPRFLLEPTGGAGLAWSAAF
jgi:membrane-associated phospholipid phosphatase